MKSFALIFVLSLMIGVSASSKDIIVDGKNVKSLTEAVSVSEGGDKIIVEQGTYTEANIVIEHQLEITGKSKPVIDGNGKAGIFIIRVRGVKISGLVIKNSAFSSMTDHAAIRIENTDNCTIENNELYDNYFGVYLANSSFCTVKGNIIKSNAKSESSSGNGVHAWKCNNIIIESNVISGHRDGIYFEFVTSSRITKNTSTANIRYGLHFMFSNNDDYENNIFRQNGAGVAVMYTKFVTMKYNTFEDNWGGGSYGLLLKDITDSYVYKNTFRKNTCALYSEGGIRIKVESNSFIENGWANKILGNNTEDTIIGNNYIGNTFDVGTNSSRNVNVFSRNYWDKFSGYDLDKNGFGDVGYRPVSLFSMIVESTPEAIVLLHSFVVDLLDVTERVIPVFIPETLVDEKPRMERWQ